MFEKQRLSDSNIEKYAGWPGLTKLRIGKPKAAVLPVPVWARATKSVALSLSINGMTFSWMGVGLVNPSSEILERISAFRFNSENSIVSFFLFGYKSSKKFSKYQCKASGVHGRMSSVYHIKRFTFVF